MFGEFTMKDVVQCFVLKPTTGKYFSLNKKGFMGGFGHLLNMTKVYEYVEVKGKLL